MSELSLTFFKRSLLLVLLVVSYVYVIRPARKYYASTFVEPMVKTWLKKSSDGAELVHKSGKSFYLTSDIGGIRKEIIYAPQFGLFWVLAVSGLLFITFRWQYYLFIFLVHLLLEILAIVSLWIGSAHLPVGLLFVDFIVAYLSPIISMAMIPMVILIHKNENRTRDY